MNVLKHCDNDQEKKGKSTVDFFFFPYVKIRLFSTFVSRNVEYKGIIESK